MSLVRSSNLLAKMTGVGVLLGLVVGVTSSGVSAAAPAKPAVPGLPAGPATVGKTLPASHSHSPVSAPGLHSCYERRYHGACRSSDPWNRHVSIGHGPLRRWSLRQFLQPFRQHQQFDPPGKHLGSLGEQWQCQWHVLRRLRNLRDPAGQIFRGAVDPR